MENNNYYDDLRKKNIAERNAVFAEFFNELKKQSTEVKDLENIIENTDNEENEPPKKRRRIISGNIDEHFKGRRTRFEVRKKYNTRSRTKNLNPSDLDLLNNLEFDDSLTESKNDKPKLQVLFPWAKSVQRSIDLMQTGVCDVDQEEEQYSDDDLYDCLTKKNFIKVNRNPYDPDSVPSVDEITKDMLNNVAEKSTLKEYSKTHGTSCHQCRQKTLDTKTVCRSGECIGVRGQFCGPCLRGRYGENAVEALKDPNWACPPCRGLCNCSICRTRNGLRPTGILAPVVQEEGYSSVMDYLQSTEPNNT